MGGRRKNRNDTPVLMGLPSPSLAKINRMDAEELDVHIERLVTDGVRISAKIERLEKIDPVPEEQIEALNGQLARLDALWKIAKDRLLMLEEIEEMEQE